MSTNPLLSKKRQKPILLATHPRACSTAFERVFMSHLRCVHEPFGDAFYFGPERLGERYEGDEVARSESGFADMTFGDVVEGISGERENGDGEGKRLFIKDMAYYLFPPDGKPASIAPSLLSLMNGIISTDENGNDNASDSTDNGSPTINSPPSPYTAAPEHLNPTVIPLDVLRLFHWTFLIRHPRSSIPSYYRCTIPPLSHQTGFHHFLPSEAGYAELRRLFEYLRTEGVIGPRIAGEGGRAEGNDDDNDDDKVDICLVDADALLNNPPSTVQAFCASTHTPYDPAMLSWSSPASRHLAQQAFAKWKGFHDDAIESTELRPGNRTRTGTAATTTDADRDDEDREWRERFGDEGARLVRDVVDACLEDYEFLRGFAMRV